MARFENIERGCARSTQLIVSIGLSALFLLVYGWCNWFTAQRANVPSVFFEWERLIPFVPLMIAPYLSIDLFFVAAPFLCRTNRELTTFSKRIAAAILVGGLCFLLFPFRFAFERPNAAGWLGAVFDWFRGMDRPYNLLPSLHIALLTILAHIYARHTRGLLRAASNLWFVLIALSAVLTYQHHVMDVVAGFALGLCCLYFFPEPVARSPVIPNRRVGSYYLVGAIVAGSLGFFFWPSAAFLIWPTISLAIMAAGYFRVGPGVFRKKNGRVPWTTRWILAPILLGQQISRLYYRRQGNIWDELTPHVWIGGVLNRGEAANLIHRGVTAVLDLTAEFAESPAFRALHYKNVQILDLTAPTPEQLTEIVSFIEEEARSGIVFVHCKIGYSRTAAVAAAYLIWTHRAASAADAIECVRRVRPGVVIRREVLGGLEHLAVDEFSSRPVPRSLNNRDCL